MAAHYDPLRPLRPALLITLFILLSPLLTGAVRWCKNVAVMGRIQPNNVRVYGVLLRAGHVLIAAEKIGRRDVLKFPGGAVEAGETPEAALKREFIEEGNLAVTPAYLLHVPGTLFSPWTQGEYTPIFYRVLSEGKPRVPDHETVELTFMDPKQAIDSGRMAAPEILALKRALNAEEAS